MTWTNVLFFLQVEKLQHSGFKYRQSYGEVDARGNKFPRDLWSMAYCFVPLDVQGGAELEIDRRWNPE